jgi:hypothetical protein
MHVIEPRTIERAVIHEPSKEPCSPSDESTSLRACPATRAIERAEQEQSANPNKENKHYDQGESMSTRETNEEDLLIASSCEDAFSNDTEYS